MMLARLMVRERAVNTPPRPGKHRHPCTYRLYNVIGEADVQRDLFKSEILRVIFCWGSVIFHGQGLAVSKQ